MKQSITIRIQPEEAEMLTDLAEQLHMSRTQAMHLMIRSVTAQGILDYLQEKVGGEGE